MVGLSRESRYKLIPEAVEEARNQLGLKHPIRVLSFPAGRDTRGGYAGLDRDPMTGMPCHRIHLNHDKPLGGANWALHHELAHALQTERDGPGPPTTSLSDEEYAKLPREIEAEEVARRNADLQLIH